MPLHPPRASTTPGCEATATDDIPRSGQWWAPALALAAILIFVAVVRLGVAATPLERDEGEYAYVGQLILQGTPPYQAAYNMKFPGTYYAYAGLLAVFGETPAEIREGLLLVNAATIVLVFLVGRRALGTRSAIVAAWVFALLSMSPRILGLFAHATHFVLLPLMAALWNLANTVMGIRPVRAFFEFLRRTGKSDGPSPLEKDHRLVLSPGQDPVPGPSRRSGGSDSVD